MAYTGLDDIELLSEDIDLKTGLIKINSIENSEIPISESVLIILEKYPESSSKYRFPNMEANSKKCYERSFEFEL